MAKRFKVAPANKAQWVMVALMLVFWVSALLWVVPELIGVFSETAEDTYSEVIWDLPLAGMLAVVGLHIVGGVLLLGSAWHFVEGYGRRRRIEKGEDIRG